MPLKKTEFADDEIEIYGGALIYKRGDYWQMRMWLEKEKKYARFSLKTRNRDTAEDKAKKYYHQLMADQLGGKTYFSKTTKQGVEAYLEQRLKDVDAGIIVKGRYGTIRTHLEHWLNFIGRDTKLKELERTDCENYYHTRTKTKKNIKVSQTTVENEQSTINAMMSWLFNRNETLIESFFFKKLPRIDQGNELLRRNSFTDDEIGKIREELLRYVAEGRKDLSNRANATKFIVALYLLCSIITGMRRGEQLQLRRDDISLERAEDKRGVSYSFVKIHVRMETTKVRKSRSFYVDDMYGSFDDVLDFSAELNARKSDGDSELNIIPNRLIFSVDGINPLTARSILYHFDNVLKDAGIKDLDKRNLVPYSFRHYCITKMVNSKKMTLMSISEVCGTSIAQIEKTYYHTTRLKMIENALFDDEFHGGFNA